MERRTLTEVLLLNQSGTWGDKGDENDFPVLRSSNIQDGRLTLNDVAYRKISKNKINEFKLEDGDILVTKSSGSSHLIGKCCLFKNPNGKTFLYSNFTQRLRVNKNILLPELLFHYLNSPFAKEYLQKISNTTSGLRNLNMKDYAKQSIPILPIKEQRKIASILEQADAVRQKRKQANQLTEQFLQAAFLKMFGDPVRKEKGWQLVLFSEVGSLNRGLSKHRPRNAPFLLGGKYPLIQTGEVANCNSYIKEFTQTYSEEGLKQSKIWKKGTLLITIAANIAKTGILSFDACFPDSIVGFIPNEKTCVEYIQYWISFLQKTLEENAPESAQKNINLDILRKLKLPLPPLPIQQKFASLVEQVEQLRVKQRESEKELENLFGSLMQRYFG